MILAIVYYICKCEGASMCSSHFDRCLSFKFVTKLKKM